MTDSLSSWIILTIVLIFLYDGDPDLMDAFYKNRSVYITDAYYPGERE